MDIPPRSVLIKKPSLLKNPRFVLEKWIRGVFRDGLGASISIIKVMLPVSLAVAVMKYFGLIEYLSAVVSPVIRFLGLPGEAVLPLITGYLVNCYSALAIMATLPLTGKEITILSVMLVICHTLPVELGVQKRAGGSFWLLLAIRLFASLLMGWLLNLWLPDGQVAMALMGSAVNIQGPETIGQMLLEWLSDNLIIVKIVGINILLILIYRLLKQFHILEKLGEWCGGMMGLLGLPKQTAFLWVVANITGLISGAALLVEAKNQRTLDDVDLAKLNVSLSTCHALLQETANFAAIGACVGLLVFPRFVIAIISVWIFNIITERFQKM